MFYANHTTLEIIGQLLIATLFLGTLLINATTKVKQHADRMAAMNVPMPMGMARHYRRGLWPFSSASSLC